MLRIIVLIYISLQLCTAAIVNASTITMTFEEGNIDLYSYYGFSFERGTYPYNSQLSGPQITPNYWSVIQYTSPYGFVGQSYNPMEIPSGENVLLAYENQSVCILKSLDGYFDFINAYFHPISSTNFYQYQPSHVQITATGYKDGQSVDSREFSVTALPSPDDPDGAGVLFTNVVLNIMNIDTIAFTINNYPGGPPAGYGNFIMDNITVNSSAASVSTAATPEPSAIITMTSALGLIGAFGLRRRIITRAEKQSIRT